ncbi:MAG: nucleoside hydrolase [Bacteroidales bacterium]|nr:nucleoside hydrolase [Bacteroidales bacterium]
MLNKTLILIVVLALSLPTQTFAHKRAKYNIVIDTDAGADDFRAITLFCASKDFNINCITTVDGVLDPKTGANYISMLMGIYHHEGIPVGAGKDYKASKKFEKHALPFWKNVFENSSEKSFPDAISLIGNSIKSEKGRTIIVAMGPLSNISEMISEYPENILKTEMILWFCEFDKTPIGFNYEQDANAYEEILAAGIPIKMISAGNVKYSSDFTESCVYVNSIYSKTLIQFAGDSKFEDFYLWDELLPLYLLHPVIFNERNVSASSARIELKHDAQPEILITAILNSEKPESGVVFNEIPTDGYMVMGDVGKFTNQIIEKHGYSEYKIAALTSEIHSHMGIYSILGAKTGLRIMEYLHAGLDEIEIVSYAGFNPPISCFNDGIQVGTGSTIGYGTISIDTTQPVSPSVLVKYNGREILFSVKPSIIEKAKNDVGALIKAHGLESEMYWLKLRELSIENYWLGISRFDLLDIEEVK